MLADIAEPNLFCDEGTNNLRNFVFFSDGHFVKSHMHVVYHQSKAFIFYTFGVFYTLNILTNVWHVSL